MRISKKVAEIWLKLFKKIEIYATILDNNVKYNYRKAVTQYMNRFELVVPCHFGLEAVVKREIYDLGYEITRVEDGRVSFEGDAEAICRANIFLRGAERVLLQVGRFKAATFDELFENVKALPWENYIPKDGRFWVKKASSIKSKLFSPSDIQSIVKKAMVERMKRSYHIDWFPEDGAQYPVRVFLYKDEVMVTLDTSGDSLHKRGYRLATSKAPLTETLAASLIMLTPWHADRILVDPFCGSGTFPIEAAMMAANIAPGMNREFTAESWTNIIPRKLWYEAVQEAEDMIDKDVQVDIQGYDIDPDVVAAARENAKRAGVEHMIHFQQRAVADLHHPKKYGFIISNPPYGERLEEKSALPALYSQIGEAYKRLDAWSMYLITSYEDTERYIGRKAGGVEHMIHFQQRAVADLHHPKKYGFIISNPPYGERLEEKSALPALYSQIGEAYKRLDAWSMYLITSYEDTERYIGRKADKNRKIYNGMIKTYFYQFMGPKPPRRKKD